MYPDQSLYPANSVPSVARLLDRLMTGDEFVEFLTEPAYGYVASYSKP